MAISHLQPVVILLVLRAFASLPTQAAARGGHDPSGLSLPSLPL
jgi:carboxypeptidase D